MIVNYLDITKEECFLIGYKLKLSPTERAILFEIANKESATIDELLHLLSDGVSRGNIAVHINSINKKANAVSGRRLVLFDGEHYILNPNM
jgi:hypothetical protein